MGYAIRRPRLDDTAGEIDRRCGFRERFLTVLDLGDARTPWAEAVRSETRAALARLETRHRFPVRLTRRWAVAGVLLAAVVGAHWLVPAWDLFGWIAEHRREQARREAQRQVRTEIGAEAEAVREVVSRLQDPRLAAAAAKLGETEPTKRASPVELRRSEIRKLSSLRDRLRRKLSTRAVRASRHLREMLRHLPPRRSGALRDLRAALAGGNYDRAAREVDALRKKLASGEMDPAKCRKVAEDLKALSDQVEKLAARHDPVRDALRAQNLDDAAVDDAAEKLAAAGEDGQLSELAEQLAGDGVDAETLQKLRELARSGASDASRDAGQLARAMRRCSAGGELDAGELERLMQQMQGLFRGRRASRRGQQALDRVGRAIARLGKGACKGRGVGKRGMPGDGKGGSRGAGLGGRGGTPSNAAGLSRIAGSRGQGGGAGRGEAGNRRPTARPTPEDTVDSLSPGKGSAPAVARWFFQGAQVKGDARLKVGEAVRSGAAEADEAISEQRIPQRYAESVKRYFGGLAERDAE